MTDMNTFDAPVEILVRVGGWVTADTPGFTEKDARQNLFGDLLEMQDGSVHLELIEPDTRPTRYALAYATPDAVAKFLPGNYKVAGYKESHLIKFMLGDAWRVTKAITFIAGKDSAGWTLHGYVLPRLASALIDCEELKGESS